MAADVKCVYLRCLKGLGIKYSRNSDVLEIHFPDEMSTDDVGAVMQRLERFEKPSRDE
jgi:hypothetical protein